MAALIVEVWRVLADDIDPLDTWLAVAPEMPDLVGTGWAEDEAREAWWLDWIETSGGACAGRAVGDDVGAVRRTTWRRPSVMRDDPHTIADDITDVLLPAICRLVARADYDGDTATLLRIQKRLVAVVRDMTREDDLAEGRE